MDKPSGTDTENFMVDNLPIEIWERILLNLNCDSWNNLAKAFDVVNDAICSIKKIETEKCKKSLKRIPFEHFLELKEISGNPKKTSNCKIIDSYVNHWKFHSIDKVKLKPIPFSGLNVTVDYMDISGRWVFLFTQHKSFTGFKMVHLDSLALQEYRVPHPWLYVEKFTFVRSVDFKKNVCHCSEKNVANCWCDNDLGHDYLQVLLPVSLRIMQSGAESHYIQLHPLQRVTSHSEFPARNHAYTGSFFVTSGKFKLSFKANFGFDDDSFASHKNPQPHVYVFEGNTNRTPKGRRLLDVSVSPVPRCDTFRAILFILDETDSSYKLLFLLGPHITHSRTIGPLLQAWLYRGSLLIGLRASGHLYLATARAQSILRLPAGRCTSVALRGNLLAVGTRDGALLLYRTRGKPSAMPETMTQARPEKELRVATEAIQQIVFVTCSAGPEILVLTESQKLYHIKL